VGGCQPHLKYKVCYLGSKSLALLGVQSINRGGGCHPHLKCRACYLDWRSPAPLEVQSVLFRWRLPPGFFFLAAKYGGTTCGWCICNQPPTTSSPSIFCSQKKEPWLPLVQSMLFGLARRCISISNNLGLPETTSITAFFKYQIDSIVIRSISLQ
jgi:hypothetical protein